MSVEAFTEELFAPETGAYDQFPYHHEFTQGLHGRKVDFGKIEAHSPFYKRWISTFSDYLLDWYGDEALERAVLIGVADGMNGPNQDIATELVVPHLETEKIGKSAVRLTVESVEKLQEIDPELVIITEDAGTRGTTSSSGVISVYENRNPGLKRVEVAHTFLRGIPIELQRLGVAYHAMINRQMDDYSADVCKNKGYCHDEWRLIKHGE